MAMKSLDEAAGLLDRARELLIGRQEYSKLIAPGVRHLTWDFAQTATIRAAAILAAAAVDHLADDLDARDAPGMTEEELDEALRTMDDDNVDANLPQTPETANSKTVDAAREEGETQPQAESGADGQHPDEAAKVA